MPAMRSCLWAAILAAALAVAQAARPEAALHLAAAFDEQCGAGENCSPLVNVTLYGEALCPYTAAFITQTLAPLLPPGGRPYITFWGIIKFQYVAWGNAKVKPNGQPQCQHGVAECRLNRLINCAQKLHPAQREWLPFVVCLEGSSLQEMEGAVNGCAEDAGLDPVELHTCATGTLGAQLEQAAAAQTAALHPAHTYVPWVLVNRVPLFDLDTDLKRFVCVAFPGRKPESCWDAPSAAAAPPPLRATPRGA